MHPLLSCSRMQCTCRCGSVHISLTHTTRSLSQVACSLARSLTHSHSGTQSGGGTLTSRWLSRSSHHSERRHSHISLALSLFTSRWLARSLIRTQALRAAALSHLAGSLALHITLCLLSRSLALPCVCRSRSRVSRCAGPGLAPVCVPGARPPVSLSLFTSRWLARSLIRTQSLRAAALSHLAGSLALHITLCLLSRSLALPCVCRSRSRVSRCAGPGLAPVCVPGARPPVCRESYNCVNIITTASVTVTLSRMAQVMCTCVAT